MVGEPLTNVPFIGEKSERDLRRIIRDKYSGKTGELTVGEATRAGKSVLQAKLDKRQREKLGEYTNNGPLKFLTRDEKTQRSRKKRKQQRDQDRGKDKGGRTGIGDFVVERSDRRQAYEEHQERSEAAREVDNRRRATVTTDFETWQSAPDQYDFPGIDTPKRKTRISERDVPFVREQDARREPDTELDFGTGLPGVDDGDPLFSEEQLKGVQELAQTSAAGEFSDTLEGIYWDDPTELDEQQAEALATTAGALRGRDTDRLDVETLGPNVDDLLPVFEKTANRFR